MGTMRRDDLQPHHDNFKVMGNRLGTSAPSFLANMPGLCKWSRQENVRMLIIRICPME